MPLIFFNSIDIAGGGLRVGHVGSIPIPSGGGIREDLSFQGPPAAARRPGRVPIAAQGAP
jgi:hypothetical protein